MTRSERHTRIPLIPFQRRRQNSIFAVKVTDGGSIARMIAHRFAYRTASSIASSSSSSSAASAASSSRLIHSTPRATAGFFQRPPQVPTFRDTQVTTTEPKVAEPHTPPHVPAEQSPNYPDTWSETQASRQEAQKGPRFEQQAVALQPQPLSAMEMIQREPIRLTATRIVSCDGGE